MCHFDPLLNEEIGMFKSKFISNELKKQQVGEGDLFLFWMVSSLNKR